MVNNSLVKKETKQGITSFLNGELVKNHIAKAIGKENEQRFITSIVSAVNANPALSECTNNSILSSALLGESLKLSPSPQLGHYYMVPYDNRKAGVKEAQFQLGYKGYLQLAMRSGQYKKINVVAIKEGELIKYDPLNEEIEVNLIEDDELREETPTSGYYAMFEYVNGFRKAIYWSKKRMLKHADKYSASFSLESTSGRYPKVSYADYEAGNYNQKDEWLYSSNWYKDFDGMAYKTMLRQLISKWGIMSIELQTAFESDMAVLKEDGSREYVDNPNIIDIAAEDIATGTVEAPKEEKKEENTDVASALFS